MKKNIANIITAVRIFGAAVLLFVEPLTVEFYIIYTACGLSDAVDGFVARAMKTVSSFGSKLDSIADLLFYAVMFLKVFPVLLDMLELYIWLFGISAVAVRIVIYILGAFKYKKFTSLHTIFNKITGLMVFLIPYSLKTAIGMYYCLSAGIMANISAWHELSLHLRNKAYRQKTA